jgi:hypothetical protein
VIVGRRRELILASSVSPPTAPPSAGVRCASVCSVAERRPGRPRRAARDASRAASPPPAGPARRGDVLVASIRPPCSGARRLLRLVASRARAALVGQRRLPVPVEGCVAGRGRRWPLVRFVGFHPDPTCEGRPQPPQDEPAVRLLRSLFLYSHPVASLPTAEGASGVPACAPQRSDSTLRSSILGACHEERGAVRFVESGAPRPSYSSSGFGAGLPQALQSRP